MAGIMAVYAISGVLLIHRDTDFLKKKRKSKKIETNIPTDKLGKELKIKGFKKRKKRRPYPSKKELIIRNRRRK